MRDESALVIVGDPDLGPGELGRIRELSSRGATVVAWQHSPIVQDRFRSPEVAAVLRGAGITCVSPAEALGEGSDVELDEAVIAWMKTFGRKPLRGGESFREQFRIGTLVAWWWAEIYLYHETPLRLIVRDIEALARLVEKISPGRIVVVRPVRRLLAAARSFASDVEAVGPALPGPPYWWRTTLLHARDLLKMVLSGLKSALRRRPRPEPGSPRVLFLTHASMWRKKRDPDSDDEDLAEMYFDRIFPAVAMKAVTTAVAFGPPVPFRQRTVRSIVSDWLEFGEDDLPYRPIRRYFSLRLALRLSGAFLECWRLYGKLRRTPGLEQTLSHRGVTLGREGLACFRDTFLRQFPWAVRSYAEVTAVLERDEPDVLVLYAESSGLGRAAVAAARARGIPSVAVQHGIMYPQYYSHEHAPDEIEYEGGGGESVPIPTRTAVFGELAKELLVRRGSYPEDRIVVTGSPKFDLLVKAAEGYDRGGMRRGLDIPDGARFLVLATRWSAVSPVFYDLVAAVERIDGLFLLVKPHQAESPRPYQRVVERLAPGRTRILPGTVNLTELLFASDGLITVDSFASSEALVLGRPVLVVNLPGNLDSLVERGVALGVRRGGSIEEALRALLFDSEISQELERKRQQYIQDFAFGADGRSTDRITRCILSEAERSSKAGEAGKAGKAGEGRR